MNGSSPIEQLRPNVVDDDEEDVTGLGDVAMTFFKKAVEKLGFTKDCHNKGFKNSAGLCECPPYFEGDFCEKVVCLNNGTLPHLVHSVSCNCPYPRYITGRHCEVIHCENGGKPLSNGSCQCIDEWYSGQFCQYYASSWLAVLAIPVVCLIVIVVLCVICRIDIFPNKSDSQRRRNRRRGSPSSHPTESQPRELRPPTRNIIQLADHQPRPPASAPAYDSQQHNNENYKYMEPPPTYEDAIAQCHVITMPAVPSLSQPSQPTPQDLTNQENRN